jgi:hypothetical protein
LVFGWAAVSFTAAVAQEQATVIRVEEDWQLVVREPDAESTAPQVTCVISPCGDLDGLYASIELNHQTQPDFASGGVHLPPGKNDLELRYTAFNYSNPASVRFRYRPELSRLLRLPGGSACFALENGIAPAPRSSGPTAPQPLMCWSSAC